MTTTDWCVSSIIFHGICTLTDSYFAYYETQVWEQSGTCANLQMKISTKLDQQPATLIATIKDMQYTTLIGNISDEIIQ